MEQQLNEVAELEPADNEKHEKLIKLLKQYCAIYDIEIRKSGKALEDYGEDLAEPEEEFQEFIEKIPEVPKLQEAYLEILNDFRYKSIDKAEMMRRARTKFGELKE